ncbi:MAG: hypothetical protein ACFFAS_07720 [Promethearchaeota archaeon]
MIRYNELWNALKTHNAYRELQEICRSHPPQHVLKQVDRNFKSFFNTLKEWKKNPTSFQGMPMVPLIRVRTGVTSYIFTSLQCRVKNGHILLTEKMERLGFPKIKMDLESVKGVRIVPLGDRYNIKLIYE